MTTNTTIKKDYQEELYNEILSSEDESEKSDEDETANNNDNDHKHVSATTDE